MYDSALTISSRRLFTLSPRPSTPLEATTRPLNTSYGLPPSLPPPRQASGTGNLPDFESRPRTASSTFSNPASQHRGTEPRQQDEAAPRYRRQPSHQQGTPSTSPEVEAPLPPTPPHSPSSDTPPPPCAECIREANTYLVELTNHPALDHPNVRAQSHYRGDYDAVLLVYDVGNRDSFEAVRDLHAEIPLRRRRNHYRRRSSHSGLGRKRSSLWLGGGGGGSSSNANVASGGNNVATGDRASIQRSSSSAGYNGGGTFGGGETVVGLIGNKSDVDSEYGLITPEGILLMEEKRGALQEADVEERSLLHPLYRESQMLMAGADGDGDDEKRLLLRLLPGSDAGGWGGRDGVISPLMSPRSLRTFPGIPEGRQGAVARSRVRERFSMGGVRRSIMSADQDLGGQRISMLSRRSVRSVQEGKERVLPKMPTRARRTEAIEKWIQTGSPTVGDSAAAAAADEEAVVIDPEELTHADTIDSEATTASKRQVSRLEGELLARALLLNVPFFEASAKTGDNVEEAFESIIREVLREMGREVGVVEHGKCKRKHGHKPTKKKEVKKPVEPPAEGREDVWPESNASPAAAAPSPALAPTPAPERPTLDTTIDEVILSVDGESPVSASSQKRRRGSMLERLRMVFTKKPAAMAADVQG